MVSDSSIEIKNLEDVAGRGDDHVDLPMLVQLMVEQYRPFERADDAAGRLLTLIENTNTDHEAQVSTAITTQDIVDGTDNGELSPVTLKALSQFLHIRRSQLENFFHQLDSDKDKYISVDDLIKHADEHGHHLSQERVQFLYNMLDKDNDGLVSLDDFKHQLLLVPITCMRGGFLHDALEFLADEVELNGDSDSFVNTEARHGLGYFWAGGIAGVVSRTSTAPFDRLKVYLIAETAGQRKDIKLIDAIRHIYKNGGLMNFFVGNGLNVIKVFPESAIKFGSFEFAKRVFAALEGVDDPAHISRLSTFISGGVGGMCSQLCVYPIDTLKFRVQVESFSGNKKGVSLIANTALQMWKTNGIKSFYRGIAVGVFGIFPFAALDLGIFSVMKTTYMNRVSQRDNIAPEDVEMSNMAVLSMGAMSGSIGATVVYPINLVRTRIQTQGTSRHPQIYSGFFDAVKRTHQREGLRGFFRGLGPNLAKVAPSVSISYLVYENAKRLIGLQ